MKRGMMKKIAVVVGVCFCVALAAVTGAGDASALTGSREDLTSIALLDGILKCYKKTDPVVAKLNGIQRRSFTSGTAAVNAIINSDANKSVKIWVPTQVGNTDTDSYIRCKQVFKGHDESKKKDSITGLFSRFGISATQQKDPMLYGYFPDANKNKQEVEDKNNKTIKIDLSVKDASGQNGNSITSTTSLSCRGVYEFVDKWIAADYYQWRITGCSGETKLVYPDPRSYNEGVDGVSYTLNGISNGNNVFGASAGASGIYADSIATIQPYGPNISDYLTGNTIRVPANTDFAAAFRSSNFAKIIKDTVEGAFDLVYNYNASATVIVSQDSAASVINGTSDDSYYAMFGYGSNAGASAYRTQSALIAESNFATGNTGGNWPAYIAWHSEGQHNGEKIYTAKANWSVGYIYNLYFQYLSDVVQSKEYKGHVTIGECGTSHPKAGYYYKTDKTNWCKIDIDSVGQTALQETRAIVGSSHLKKGTFQQALEWLDDKNNYKEFPEGAYAGSLNPGDNTGSEDENGDQYSACVTAAGALSWIICPTMTIMSDATQGIYNNAIEPILQVNAKALRAGNAGAGESDGVYVAWGTFRNYANIAFVIALIVVILSQLTGIGLSNYNVKKILPRLIMIVVLVNVSFILCQLAVDVSNLLGSSLKSLLEGWAPSIYGKINDVNSGQEGFFGGNILNQIMGAFLGVGSLPLLGVIGYSAIVTWHVWLVPLILTVITFLIGVLFFFIILAVRQAGIFILIAIAPLAIVCYALPNTKPLFDKWFKLFKSLLVVYPICGLMMGGSQFASALILQVGSQTNAGFFMLLAAVGISVAPFFFIPSVVKNSMGALGNIGTKLSNFGAKAGGFLGGAFMGSRFGDRIKQRTGERASNIKEEREYNAQTRRFNRDKKFLDEMHKRQANGGVLSEEELSRVNLATSRTLATAKDRANNAMQADQLFKAGGINALIEQRRQGQKKEYEEAEVKNTMAQYQNGAMDWGGGNVDINQLYAGTDSAGRALNDNSLEAEFARQVDALQANPNDEMAYRRVKALERILADKGEHGVEVMQRVFSSRLDRGDGVDAEKIRGVRKAALGIAGDSKVYSAAKAQDYGFSKMITALETGQTKGGAGESARFAAMAAGASAQAISKMGDNAVHRLLESAQNGQLMGKDLEKASKAARELMANETVFSGMKQKAKDDIKALARIGYMQGASSTTTSSTLGSNAFANSSAKEINDSAQYISDLNNGNAFSASVNASNSQEYKLIQGMAQNAQIALRDNANTYTPEQVEAMQKVIKTARDMGVQNDQGNVFNDVDASSIKVRGVKQPEWREPPEPPTGFNRNGEWDPGTVYGPAPAGPTPAQQAAADLYVRQRAAVDAYNRKHNLKPPTNNP